MIETYDRREIRISLLGTNKRGLLEIVTDKLDEIHDSFNFNDRLQVKKLIPCNCSVCKDNSEPTFYNYQQLRERLNHNKQDIECEKPPYNTVNLLSLIDDVIGREKFFKQQEKEDKYFQENHYHFHDRINNLDIQTNQTGSNTMENHNNKLIKAKSSWANGSFYLVTFIVVVAGLGYLGGNLPLITFAFVIVAGVLFVPIIGAFQLLQDDRLSEKSFLELMKMVIGQLPLIGNMLANIVNPKNKGNN